MLIHYASDLHTEFEGNRLFVKYNMKSLFPSGDILILAGDCFVPNNEFELKKCNKILNYLSESYSHVYLVYGNHEFYYDYSISDSFEKKIYLRDNIEYCQNETIKIGSDKEGRPIYLLLSTLWSDISSCTNSEKFMMNDLRYSNFSSDEKGAKKLDSDKYCELNIKCIDYIFNSCSTLKKENPNCKLIVATHHVPVKELCERSDLKGLDFFFYNDLSRRIEESGFDYWIYGHNHTNKNLKIGDTEIACNQLGYVDYEKHDDFKCSFVKIE